MRCEKCEKEILDGESVCPNCGAEVNSQSNAHKKIKIINYALIVLGTVLIVIAISLVASNTFSFYVNNIDYYTQQYESCRAQSGNGFFGSSYSYLASEWKELRDEAKTYIVSHIVGAIVLSIGGVAGIFIGLKNIRKNSNLENEDNK